MHTKFCFGNLKTRDFRFNMVHYIELIWKEEDPLVRTVYSRPEDVLYRRDELEFLCKNEMMRHYTFSIMILCNYPH